jgi:hypothetical protein
MQPEKEIKIKLVENLGIGHTVHQGAVVRLNLPKNVVEKYKLKDKKETDFLFINVGGDLMLLAPLKTVLKNHALLKQLKDVLGFIDLSKLSKEEIYKLLNK